MSIVTSGFGSLFGPVVDGESSIIESGGVLTGTYNGNVLCLGTVTMTGAVTVNGNLIVISEFVNSGGYPLTVQGSLYAQTVSFNNSDPELAQGNITIYGDFTFTDMNWIQSGGIGATLGVGGNLTGTDPDGATLDAHGLGGANGANLDIGGDIRLSTLNIYGGDSTDTSAAGNGGLIFVYGNCIVTGQLYAYGGNGSAGFAAGNGGSIDVNGNLGGGGADISFNGGQGTSSTAGNGGNIYVGNHFVANNVNTYGGYCNSNRETDRSGSGGGISVGGNFTAPGNVTLSGGDRDGTLSSSGDQTPPNGGTLEVHGHALFGYLYADGGNIFTYSFSPSDAGNGGGLIVYGKTDSGSLISTAGGDHTRSAGAAGHGGDIQAYGAMSTYNIYTSGGGADAGSGGNGGVLLLRGDVTSNFIHTYGGSGTQGSGGIGGYISIEGNSITNYMDSSGGDCDSTNNVDISGQAGYIICNSLRSSGPIYLNAGNRSGATTSLTTNAAINAGFLTVNGDLFSDTVQGTGCSITTTFPNGPGGQGSTIQVFGNAIVTTLLSTDGGSSVGHDGGAAGNITIQGSFRGWTVSGSGGGSFNSTGIGSDAATNGLAASTVILTGGATLSSITLLDGIGDGDSTAPTDSVYLNLGGPNHFRILNMVDRSASYITPITCFPTTLKIGANGMPTKHTLNNSSGTPSSDISSLVTSSIFIGEPGGEGGFWSIVTGTSLFS